MTVRLGGARPGASEVLPTAVLITQIAGTLGNAMQIGPLIGIASAMEMLLTAVQQVKSNKESCLRLVQRASAFVVNIRDTMEGKWDPAPAGIREAVDRFEALLLKIADWMGDLAKATFFMRFLKQARIQDKIVQFELQLTDAIALFQSTVLLEVQHIVGESLRATLSQESTLVRQVQSMHSQILVGFQRGMRPQDEDGFPLVHRSEVVLHGMVPMGGGWWRNLSEASVNGRQVLIKRYEGKGAKKRRQDDLAFLKSVWDARFPQLYGISQTAGSAPPFIILHNVGITDLRAFITPFLQQGQLLEVAAMATRVAEHLRAGLTMLASTGRWPSIYNQTEQPSLAMLSSLVVNNRGNIVIGGDIATDREMMNHRGPLVWLCHEIFGERYPGSILGVGENDRTRRARQLANQIAGSILLSGTESPAQVSETLLVDLRDADWTSAILRELRASMASWGLDDRGGLFSQCTYGDVGFLIADPDPGSNRKTFVGIGNIEGILGPLYAKLLGDDEPFRRRRMEGHVFEGNFDEMLISEVSADVVRFTFRNPWSITYEHQFSVHQKPKDDPSKKTTRWRSIVSHVSRFAEERNIAPDKLILITGHRTTAMISAKYERLTAQPTEVHFFLSYEDYSTSYWSYDDIYKPVGSRRAVEEPEATLTSSPTSDKRGFYIQFIPEDFDSQVA
ncbi:hypothetical protein BV25DRAFT_1918602 [Artomyces pyxidatus]|uniref:Uncharacterized protein n=1 Tax=Artomyces pyxidatus TaxID=48021 RepID=A0ACB8SU82_9AGAM|nr:hypothetical protein BV25DRAFT_1918602 [Artomyces pyxidatus]